MLVGSPPNEEEEDDDVSAGMRVVPEAEDD
jgi:hypothetical protein